ncbi:four helix bundle protein [bacterium]|nr:four helix bundle protein [bacterium]
MKGDDLSDRFVEFGDAVLTVVEGLPETKTGRHIGEQLMRSGTSCGANYEEGRGAESRGDFVHKLGVTHKELRESRFWLRLILKRKITRNGAVDVLEECEELCAIIGKSIATARTRKRSDL